MSKRNLLEHTRFFIYTVAVICGMLGPIARAEEPVMVPPATARVAVVTDDAAGVIRFVIDGKEVARVDAAGLNVEGDVTYSGGLNDRGPAVTEGAADPKGGEAGDER